MNITASLQPIFDRQRAAFNARPMPTLGQRKDALRKLKQALLDARDSLAAAANEDFGGRSPYETLFADIMPSVNAINHTLSHLRGWMRSRRRRPGWAFRPASARVMTQPLGVVGIMVPWNYPVLLAISPLVYALAAGNRAMIKLPELTPRTNAVTARLLASAFAEDEVATVLGESEVAEAFSHLPFDHLLFTGSTRVGRHIMRAAADNLTPVTLELGGKCPAILGPGADLALAAEYICLGKGLNAGQTCVGVDYVLCPRDRVGAFVEAVRQRFPRMYPTLRHNPDYSAIITDSHYRRLIRLRDEARRQGAQIIEINAAGENLDGVRKLPLTLLLDTTADMAVRQEEIFGPLLPIVPYDSLDAALAELRTQPRPLALYYFDDDRTRQRHVLTHSHSGAACINATILQLAQDDLPFGGVGASGMGAYHGREGFLTFSKSKGVLRVGRFSLLQLMFPPYRPRLMKLAERLLLR